MGTNNSKAKQGAGSAAGRRQPSAAAAPTSFQSRSEKVHTSTTTTTSSTGVVKTITVTTTTTTTEGRADGTVKTGTGKTKRAAAASGGGARAQLSKARLDSSSPEKNAATDSHKTRVQNSKPESAQQFAKNALRAHNAYRKKHGARPLKLAKDLNAYAQRWAEHLAATDVMKHSECVLKGVKIGENVAEKWGHGGVDYTGEEVTTLWYKEEEAKYDYSGRCDSGESGHFTQLVWKSTREFGVGKAANAKGQVFAVASYRPAGNYVGQFKENVGLRS